MLLTMGLWDKLLQALFYSLADHFTQFVPVGSEEIYAHRRNNHE